MKSNLFAVKVFYFLFFLFLSNNFIHLISIASPLKLTLVWKIFYTFSFYGIWNRQWERRDTYFWLHFNAHKHSHIHFSSFHRHIFDDSKFFHNFFYLCEFFSLVIYVEFSLLYPLRFRVCLFSLHLLDVAKKIEFKILF